MYRRLFAALFGGAMMLACPAVAEPAALPENPWVAMTRMDLQAMHDTIAADHYGAIDPENPGFASRMNTGLTKALALAAHVRSFDDYRRALMFYRMQFEDYHVEVGQDLMARHIVWPGFVLYGVSADKLRVVAAEADAGVKAGDTLISCDGQSADALLKERTDPYYWNRAVPQERTAWANYIFRQYNTDNRPRLKACTFSSGKVSLKWRTGPTYKVIRYYETALGSGKMRIPELKKIDGVWLLSLPTLHVRGGEVQRAMEKLISDVQQKTAELRKGPLIIDVRGNGGGSSMWAQKIVATIWGKSLYQNALRQSYPAFRVGWRVSPDNVAGLGAKHMDKLQGDMAAALKRGQKVVWQSHAWPASAAGGQNNPVSGKVYFLTDMHCFSACLTLADMMYHLPSVTHVGLPTNADTKYTELDGRKMLPGGLSMLDYAMNVYPGRVRGDNVWYTPKYRWPYDEPMTDDHKIISWIKTLK